ncbi:MAG: LysM peptidoglycan-binding domain-containing protein [Comamonadaceae bacterium]|nr:LysM peptidoglycan-binding domain-containing protein [Comamonadaceae bacterium]
MLADAASAAPAATRAGSGASPPRQQKTVAAPVAQTGPSRRLRRRRRRSGRPPSRGRAVRRACPSATPMSVQAGDTLALIARRPEIYGDASMWMMPYRGSLSQIASAGPRLRPGQVLSVPRSFSEADVKAVREEALRRAPWPPGAQGHADLFLPRDCRRRPALSPRQRRPRRRTRSGESRRRGGTGKASGAGCAPARRGGRFAVCGRPGEIGWRDAAPGTGGRGGGDGDCSGGAGARRVPAANGAAAAPAAGSGRRARPALARPASAAARGETAAAPATPTPVTVGLSRDAFRDAARRARNVGDMPWATYYYRQHLLKSPRDAGALGELGNIYYRAGNLAVAAGLYCDAARVLIDRGNRVSRAAQLLPAVSEGNPALADDLHAALDGTSAALTEQRRRFALAQCSLARAAFDRTVADGLA